MQVRFFLAATAALALAGCGGTPPPIGGAPGLQVVPGDMPPPTRADVIDGYDTYGLGPQDQLRIDVFGVPELSNRIVRVDADGQIAFPLVGTLDVSGLRPSEVSALVESRLRGRYVRDPQVTTTIEETAGRTVTVYGSVNQPGVFPVTGTSSLLEAVATARGLTEYANSQDVVVFRTIDGQRFATLYNLKAISRGAYIDPTIYPNDTVVVGESRSRRLFDTFISAATLAVTPITLLIR